MEPLNQPSRPMKKPRDSHSNFRKGLADYNDGSHLTHHLGNNDYIGQNQPDDEFDWEKSFDGKVAYGNEEFFEEDNET